MNSYLTAVVLGVILGIMIWFMAWIALPTKHALLNPAHSQTCGFVVNSCKSRKP